MQRITNCILYDRKKDQVLLLKKPRRGWWVAPGGKMEEKETIVESVVREYREETGITLIDPVLRGVFTIIVEDNGRYVDEWMMFTFLAHQYEGQLLSESPEGELAWVSRTKIADLPKARGDQVFFDHLLTEQRDDVLIKRFRYTPDYEWLSVE